MKETVKDIVKTIVAIVAWCLMISIGMPLALLSGIAVYSMLVVMKYTCMCINTCMGRPPMETFDRYLPRARYRMNRIYDCFEREEA